MHHNNQPPLLEITIISAQDLTRKACFAFSRRLRPFLTVSAASDNNNDKRVKMYNKTRVDDKGGVNPTWGDSFQVSLDRTFFCQRYPGIYLRLYTKRLPMGATQLGWCLVPAADIMNQPLPVGFTRFLSYRLRASDGSRGNGVVNVAVRLEGSLEIVNPARELASNVPFQPEMQESDKLVVGIPVKIS